MPDETRTVLIVGWLAAAAASALAVAAYRDRYSPEASITNRPIQVSEDGYASSPACRACHPSQYNSWHASYHRTMTQVATAETARADFGGVTVAGVHGRPMRLEQDGQQLWAEFDDPDASVDPDERPRIRRPVVMITGSHNQQIFWYATGKNRLLGQLPGAYLIRERRWIPRRAAVLHPPSDPPFGETGHWNSTCIACHATHGKPQFDTPFGSRPLDTQVVESTAAEFGIACEMCHGPSEGHVQANQNPLRRYWLHLSGRPDPTTVQPAHLDRRVASETCGQCHGVWEFYDERGERRANAFGLPYRPGDQLATTRFVAQPRVNGDSPVMKALLADDPGFVRDSFWPDGMVRVSGREYNGLVESPCFRNAVEDTRTLSCFSCHTMHETPDDPRTVTEWADDQLTPGMEGNEACLQCHESYRATLTEHTKHAADSPGSSCYNCHMPYTTYGLLKTIRSHTISVPSVAESIEGGRPNACNLCHLDKTLEWTAEALEHEYGTPGGTLDDDTRSTAASLLWLLRGDAGQRAIVAQAMAWPPAQRVSGTDWMAPYLATLLDDPYDAVRFIASRTLHTLPAFADFPFDVEAASARRREAQLRVMQIWDRAKTRSAAGRPQLMYTNGGAIDTSRVLRLLQQRDNRDVLLRE